MIDAVRVTLAACVVPVRFRPRRDGQSDGFPELVVSGFAYTQEAVVLRDVEVVEPRLIHAAPQLPANRQVGLSSVSDKRQHLVEGLTVHVPEPHLLIELGLLAQELGGQLLLLGGRDVVGHGPGHGLLGPLETFALDGLDLTLQVCAHRGRLLLLCAQVNRQVLTQQRQVFGRDRLKQPLVLDRPLDERGRQVALAAGCPVDARGAVEVAVLAALPPDCDGVQQFLAAAATAQATDKVMLAFRRSLTRGAVVAQDALHLLEGRCVDQRRVFALVLDAAPRDVAEVVPVAQDHVEFVGRYLAGRRLWAGSKCQTPFFQLIGQ